ncbi:Transient receptor potential cation channel subfamily A member 1-like protein [Bienertia sinuspersici]
MLVLGAAFSAVPLILLIPPMRRFSIFVVKFEDLLQDITVQTSAIYARFRFLTSLVLGASSRRTRSYRR